MGDYRRLEVWKLAHTLRLAVYRASETFPASEQFGLTSQARKAASSIAANIAEGSGRTDPDYARHLRISEGSANELEDHLLLARDVGYLGHTSWAELTADVARIRSMLIRLRKYLAKKR